MLTLVDVYSRFLWAEILPSKNQNDTLAGFERIISRMHTLPSALNCDLGTEFNEAERQCETNGVTVIRTIPEDHRNLGIVNRCHRTLKMRLRAHFRAHHTKRWIDALQDIVEGYNHTVNRNTQETPDAILNSGVEPSQIFKRTQQLQFEKATSHFQIGDTVRIKTQELKFEKKSLHSPWSKHVYSISGRSMNGYTLIDTELNSVELPTTIKPADMMRSVV